MVVGRVHGRTYLWAQGGTFPPPPDIFKAIVIGARAPQFFTEKNKFNKLINYKILERSRRIFYSS